MYLNRTDGINGEFDIARLGQTVVQSVTGTDCSNSLNLVTISKTSASVDDEWDCTWTSPEGGGTVTFKVDGECNKRPWGLQGYPNLGRKECTNTDVFQSTDTTFNECCTDGYGTPQACNFCDICKQDCPNTTEMECKNRGYFYVKPKDGGTGTCTNTVDFSTVDNCGGGIMGCAPAECCATYQPGRLCNIYNECEDIPTITYKADPVTVQRTARGLVILRPGGGRDYIGNAPVVTPVLSNDMLTDAMNDTDSLTLDEVWIQSDDGGTTEGDCRASSDGKSVVYTPREGFAGTALCRYTAKVLRLSPYPGDPPSYPDFIVTNPKGGDNPIVVFGAPTEAPSEVSLWSCQKALPREIASVSDAQLPTPFTLTRDTRDRVRRKIRRKTRRSPPPNPRRCPRRYPRRCPRRCPRRYTRRYTRRCSRPLCRLRRWWCLRPIRP